MLEDGATMRTVVERFDVSPVLSIGCRQGTGILVCITEGQARVEKEWQHQDQDRYM